MPFVELFIGFWLDLISNFLANVASTLFLALFGA